MIGGSRKGLAVVIAFAFLIFAQGAMAQSTYTLKVATDSSAYGPGQTIKVTGSVSPAPGPSTAVALKVLNPAGTVVAVGETSVGASSGLYNYTFVAGGSSAWSSGTYTLNATWGAYPPQIYAKATFAYSTTVTTTTTTTTTTTPTTTTTTTTTSTATQTTTTTTTTTATTTTTTLSTTSSSSGGGGIPAFPYAGALTALFVALVLSAYLVARKFALRGPPVPSR